MSILISDPLALIALEAGQVGTPLKEAGASGNNQLDSPQRAAVVGDPVPIVFCRRNETTGIGGVLISPAATEARFTNDSTNAVTAYYHLVLSEGLIGSIQVRDVFQRSCRVGSHTQTYNRRAGTWVPGNAIVQRGNYDKPECPYYCGSVGTYTGMSTLSFRVTIPNGFDYWNRQVHCFIRNGMEVTRLIDGVVGPSNNFADLVNWCFVNSSRLPTTLIDTAGLTAAAQFMAAVGMSCDINITESTNLADMLANMAPYFLVAETRNLGKRGLRPLLPINANNTINTGAITWEYTFTEDHILPDSFEVNYTRLADRKPICVQVIWRQQPTDDMGIIRTSEVRYAGTADDGPYEQHDLSAFCTSETHAVKVGTYILARRRYISHTLRFSVRPQIYNTTLIPGDIVRVTLQRIASGSQPSKHDYLYEVNRITKTLAGDLTFELTHFPVDSQGRSLVALHVANAVGTGIMLTTNRTGISCDVNSSSDTTIPTEEFQSASAADARINLDAALRNTALYSTNTNGELYIPVEPYGPNSTPAGLGYGNEQPPGQPVNNPNDGQDVDWPPGFIRPSDPDWPTGLPTNTDPTLGPYIAPASGTIDNGAPGFKTRISWGVQWAGWGRTFLGFCELGEIGQVNTGSTDTVPQGPRVGQPNTGVKGVFKYIGGPGACGGRDQYIAFVVYSKDEYYPVGYQLGGPTVDGWEIYRTDLVTEKVPL